MLFCDCLLLYIGDIPLVSFSTTIWLLIFLKKGLNLEAFSFFGATGLNYEARDPLFLGVGWCP